MQSRVIDFEAAFRNLLERRREEFSHLQAASVMSQSRTIVVFTVSTIIFLPLSFMSSFFGMNAREWTGQIASPSLPMVISSMIGLTLGVIILALLLAFSKATRGLIKTTWKQLIYAYKRLCRPTSSHHERLKRLKLGKKPLRTRERMWRRLRWEYWRWRRSRKDKADDDRC